MEPAHLGVILDSSIMIEAERQRLDVARFLKLLTERIGEEAAPCAISVAGLAHGIHRAGTPDRYQARRAFHDDLKAAVAIYPITADTAELVGKIHAETARQGIAILSTTCPSALARSNADTLSPHATSVTSRRSPD